jgi:hypothetical protein
LVSRELLKRNSLNLGEPSLVWNPNFQIGLVFGGKVTAIQRELELWIGNNQINYFNKSIKDVEWYKIKKFL